MKVSLPWLNELVELMVSESELVKDLNLKTIGTKEVTPEFVELDMKGHHRSDLLSLRGVAYETAAISNSKIKFKEILSEEFAWNKQEFSQVEVRVENEKAAPIYCVVKIEGLKVERSSEEWVQKLLNSGIRSINNVADVTNLVMLEFGQPLHAFDAAKVRDENIIVRDAKSGEKLITLDNKERDLESSDLLITDSEKVLGLAGVMGGKNSEVTDSTQTILLEAAIFDPKIIRKTAQRLSLFSEAGERFQHGLTKIRLLQALQAAINYYQELGGKLTAVTLVGDFDEQVNVVPLSLERVNALIGVTFTKEQVKEYLEKLHFDLEEKVEGTFEVYVPYWRLDIKIEEDLIEEVARMYGYDKIPAKKLPEESLEKIDQSLFENLYNLKLKLAKLGLTEVETYSFFSTQIMRVIQPDKLFPGELIKVMNPISKETEFLRTDLWPNLLEVVAKNQKYDFPEIAIFEIGKVYSAKEGRKEEKYRLSLALSNNSGSEVIELYQIFKQAMTELGIEFEVVKNEEGKIANDLFLPGKSFFLKQNGEIMGGISEVHPRILNELGIDKRAAILEFELKNIDPRVKPEDDRG